LKALLYVSLLFTLMNTAMAQNSEIISIDDGVAPYAPEQPDVNPEPPVYIDDFSFTPISDSTANSLFAMFKGDPRARMRHPGGACSTRRAHIQNVLRKKNIRSGKLYIKCPSNNGRLRLRDQVSGRYFTYSNFHDANVVLVGSSYKVMDVQFQSSPVSLESYLAQVRVYQRVIHAKVLDAGTCYWSVR
jgi:hypothetical protein